MTSISNLMDESTTISANSQHVQSKSQKSTPIWADYKFHIHPIIKFLLFGILNVAAFLPSFQQIRWIFLITEIILAFGIKLEIYRVQGFFKFLFMNFIGIYFLFYFVDFSWINAFILFYQYTLSMLILFLGTFIFTQTTPPRELLTALRMFHIPRKLALGITVAITFLPLLTERIRLTRAYQEARGYKVHFWNLGPIIIPSLLNILDLSMNLAISMESRGYEI
ncbi:energy-coupling factor transporter transmembrane component T [Candidatus Lokiarchaeum ossiferum]|uniref:energy-coupling factor transporter transmembrane component T n=1 Tax=Candidatus Lokiarchaeum ossiferum TaxID=2951803 RepID=UPI00352D1407